jgi:adenylylsulfate kinase-like enzyme
LINKKFNGDNSTGIAIWFTGLSGAGKSTLAKALYEKINKIKLNCKELDGDILRNGINAGLGYTEDDRMENIRRAVVEARYRYRRGSRSSIGEGRPRCARV